MRLPPLLTVCAALLAGCAARAHETEPAAAGPADYDDEHARAAALVFDPPVAAGQPRLELARAPREATAFVAYDEVFSTYFCLRMDDRQKLSRDGSSERRVISETFGVSRR